MIELLRENPLLLLFVVAAIGYPLGRISIGGSSLGVAAVLFVGLAVGSLHPDLRLPEFVYLFGLVIFVYTVGLSSGPTFFAALRRKGLRDNLLAVGTLVTAGGIALLASRLLNLKATVTAGLYAGSLTNTPALAAVLEALKDRATGSELEQLLAEPVIGYSVAYPMGVLGIILAMYVTKRLWKVDFAEEAKRLHQPGSAGEQIRNQTFRITRTDAVGVPIGDLVTRNGWNVVFARIQRGSQLALAGGSTRLAVGDLVSVIGSPDELNRVGEQLGEEGNEPLELDRHQLDYRRVFVSNPKIAGKRLRDLRLPQRFGAVVTRVRRGDIELLAHGETSLELGDRVRVVTPRENMEAVTKFFGDSYRALSEIDILPFGLGLALGLLLGMVPIPLPGGGIFKLGFAGGPLIMALVLGAIERTGPMVWSLPFSANLTLRQLGLVLFLAGVGTRSGYSFVNTLAQGGGVAIFAAGAIITFVAAFGMLWVGYRVLRIPMGLLVGILAGTQTQPAALGYALEQTKNDMPNIGYATVYPVATIVKIIIAQALLG